MKMRKSMLALAFAAAALMMPAAKPVLAAGSGAVISNQQSAASLELTKSSGSLTRGQATEIPFEVPFKGTVSFNFIGLEKDDIGTYFDPADIELVKANGSRVKIWEAQELKFDDGVYEAKLSKGKYVLKITPEHTQCQYDLVIKASTNQDIPAETITLNKTKLSLTWNTSRKIPNTRLTAAITPYYATDASSLTWTSSNPAVVKVSSKGLVKPLALGSSTVSAKIGKLKASCKVNVRNAWTEMNKGSQISAVDLVKTIPGYKTGVWKSDKSSVVSVNKKYITAKRHGVAVVTFKCKGVSYKIKVYSINQTKLLDKMTKMLKDLSPDPDKVIIVKKVVLKKPAASAYLEYKIGKKGKIQKFYGCYYDGDYYYEDDAKYLIDKVK